MKRARRERRNYSYPIESWMFVALMFLVVLPTVLTFFVGIVGDPPDSQLIIRQAKAVSFSIGVTAIVSILYYTVRWAIERDMELRDLDEDRIQRNLEIRQREVNRHRMN